MRRFSVIFICAVLLLGSVFCAGAEESASRVDIFATVGADESCQVAVTAMLHTENTESNLTFPVPMDATSVTLNGSRVRTSVSGNARFIDLSSALKGMVGDFTVTVHYMLPDVIDQDAAGSPQLELPLLSGFSHPISYLEFSVTLPGEVTEKPAFSSGYHQANIEKDLSVTYSGATITGKSLTGLKDHETLTMTLPVSQELFPNAPLVLMDAGFTVWGMVIAGALALLYWLLFLRCLPGRPGRAATPPEGISAGQLGTALTLGQTDLSLTVFSWAQLGYLEIQTHRKGRILLQKRMDMGNERSGYEQKLFRELFGRRSAADCASLYYVNLCKKARHSIGDLKSLISPKSGNSLVFRVLWALICVFFGVSVAIAMTQGAALQVFWAVVLGALWGLLGWLIQEIAYELFIRKSALFYLGLCCGGICLGLSAIAGNFSGGILCVLVQFLGGLMAAYGGRRTETGKQTFSQVLALRRYLITASKGDIARICENDPGYFFNLAPYALALGVEKSFARRFGKLRLERCSYLLCPDGSRTAYEWSLLLGRTLSDMDRRSRMQPLEKLTALVALLRK